jgi:hypothetical protein
MLHAADQGNAMQDNPRSEGDEIQAPKKASLGQVAATLFWGMCMIGKRGTWERNGATITLKQAIVGAIIAACVIVTLLLLLAHFALRFS